jgi:predicted dehydrogenase
MRDGLRVAVVGCGLIGRRRATVVRRSTSDTLIIVADAVAERAAALGRELDCRAVVDWRDVVDRSDVDAVVVATTHDWLAPIAVEAVRRGKHVLIEKPMARSPREAETILAASGAVDNGRPRPGDGRVIVKAGFNHRHHDAIWKAHDLMQRGAIGEPYFIRCRYGHGGRPGYASEWRGDRTIAGGGELLDQGIHAIDLFRWFLGDFIEGVGFAPTYFWAGGDDVPRGEPVEDNAFCLFRTAGGQVASLHASWTQWKNIFSYEVFGRDGYLAVDGLGGSYGSERLTVGRRRAASGPPDEEHFEFAGDSSWEREWLEFRAAIRERREPLGSGYDAWQALRMACAVYESQRTGRLIRMDDDAA